VIAPYYDRDGFTIYNADCLELLAARERVLGALGGELHHVITDPPYGLMETDGGKVQMRGAVTALDYGDWDRAYSFEWIALLPASIKSAVVFHDHKRASGCWDALLAAGITPRQFLYWDKGDSGINPRRNFVNTIEQAVYARRGPSPWNGGGSTVNVFRRDRGQRLTAHPTEKPEDLMSWIIRCVTDAGDLVLDPFMGSGTTLVAAKRLGRRAIGIERERDYCDMAIRRLAQGALFASAGV
jgi:site-specific DNA-methyltransferase (adenine-specific)